MKTGFRKLSLVVLVVLIAATTGALFLYEDKEQENTELVAAAENRESPTTISLSGIDANALKKLKAKSDRFVNDSGLHPFPNIPKVRDGLPLESDPFGATSIAEQKWLDRNGYPNEKQFAAYSSAPDTLLQQAADAGDSSAAVMLNYRKLLAGDEAAQEELLMLAAEGSAYALDTYSSFLAGSKSYGDPASSYVLSRVAEMRGNYLHGLMRETMLPKPPTPVERMHWNAESIRLFREMQKMHEESYKNSSPWLDSRPMELSGGG